MRIIVDGEREECRSWEELMDRVAAELQPEFYRQWKLQAVRFAIHAGNVAALLV